MQQLFKIIASGVIALAGATSAHAGGVTVVCGDSTLGLRTTTVDPAKSGSCWAGLQNPGDPQLEALVTAQYGLASPGATILDRDTTNGNGGSLTITGVGLGSGTWSFDANLWNANERLFLFFHFGDGKDDPSTTSTTDPDAYIVELVKADAVGTWAHFDGTDDGKQKFGLSNIALLGYCESGDCGGDDDDVEVPEPGSLALVAIGLMGAAYVRRRRV
jgi:PEP-CTERM motif